MRARQAAVSCGGRMAIWVISDVIGIGEGLDDEHVGTKEVTFRI